MMASTLSASFGYVDIAILVLLGLFLILGLIRGLSKSLNGFFLAITTMLISLLMLGVTFAPVRDTAPMNALNDTLSQSSASWGDCFNDPVSKLEDGSFVADHDGAQVALNSLDGIKGKLAALLAKQFYVEDGQTVADMVTSNLTSLIAAIILFVAYCIAFGIIFAIIRHLTKKMHRSDNTGVAVIDRVCGGVIATALGLVFVLVILAIFSALQAQIPSVIEYIQNSAIGKFFYDINPIGKVFAEIFGI